MQRKLRLAITCYPSIGGSGIVASELGNELARQGHEVHFISYEPPFRLDIKLPKVHFHKVKLNEYGLFKCPDYTLPLAVKMCEVYEKYRLDILHVHYAVPHATAALLARHILCRNGDKGPKIITTLHGTDITLLGRDPSLHSIICYSIEFSDGVTAVSESLKRETMKVFLLRKKIEVIHNFFTAKKISKSRHRIRKKLGISQNDLCIIHLSNLRPVKRIPDILKTLSRIPRTFKVKLVILAGASFEAFWPLVRKFNLLKKVIVLENVFDIENYLNASDIGFYPSESESFGMGILETMSFGHPIIATNIGGIPEVVENNKSGFLYNVGDITGYTLGIKKFLSQPLLLKTLGENAFLRAKKYFSTQKAVDHYLHYYFKILGEKNILRKDNSC